MSYYSSKQKFQEEYEPEVIDQCYKTINITLQKEKTEVTKNHISKLQRDLKKNMCYREIPTNTSGTTPTIRQTQLIPKKKKIRRYKNIHEAKPTENQLESTNIRT